MVSINYVQIPLEILRNTSLSRNVFDSGLNFITKSFCTHVSPLYVHWYLCLCMYMYRPVFGAALYGFLPYFMK